jgi:hypothetical protein
MTVQEWLAATDYHALLIYLRGDLNVGPHESVLMPGLHCGAGYLAIGEAQRVSGRKLRLFAAALCQRWCTLPLDDLCGAFLRTYERFANDAALWDDIIEVGMAVQEAFHRGEQPWIDHLARFWPDTPCAVARLGDNLTGAVAGQVARDSIAVTCKDATEEDWWEWDFSGGPPDPLYQSTRTAVQQGFPSLLREIVGNPFRSPSIIDPFWLAWNDGTVPKIAQGIYNERAFDRLPVLADALLDAGCTDPDLLDHLRGPGPHVRGCHVLDLLLGR